MKTFTSFDILYHNTLLIYIIGWLQCTAWPSSPSYGCSIGGEWVKLDSALGESDYTICEELCTKKGQSGCCYLRTTLGCFWRPEAIAQLTESTNLYQQLPGIAITCTRSGKYSISI